MLSISTDTLTDLAKEIRSRESAHPRRGYSIELHPCGFILHVIDRNPNSPVGVDRPISLDALAMSGMEYARIALNHADDKIEKALASLSRPGQKDAAI